MDDGTIDIRGNDGPRLTALGLSQMAARMNQPRRSAKVAKASWNECGGCGVIFDVDESHCPNCGNSNENNPGLIPVELGVNEIRESVLRGKTWTKRPQIVIEMLSQSAQ